VNPVSKGIIESNPRLPDGKQQATRKNLPVIDVVSDQNLPVNYWFIMWMAINITPGFAI
jgi:hypothetical protein